MANTILLKRSATAAKVPLIANLSLGELSINTWDGRLYTKKNNGSDVIVDLTQNDPITLSGDATGTSTNPSAGLNYSNLAITLATVNSNTGTWGGANGVMPTFTVNGKGLVTAAGNITLSSLAITMATANVALYEQLTNSTTNATFYLPFFDKATGNASAYTNTSVNVNPSTGTVSALAFAGGTGAFGTTTVAGVDSNSTTTGALKVTGGVGVSANVTAANVFATGVFVGSGSAISGLFWSANNQPLTTGSSGTITTANVALFASASPYTTNQTFYPTFSNISTAGNTTIGVSSALSYNPSTGNLTTAGFVGTHWGTAGITTGNAATFTITANAIINTTMYAQGAYDFSNRVVSAAASGAALPGNLTVNANGAAYLTQVGPGALASQGSATTVPVISTDAYGRVTALTTSAIAISATAVSGTIATANVALYEQLTNSTTNATFYLPFFDKATGNASAYTNTAVNVNPSTGTVSALAFAGGTGAFGTTTINGVDSIGTASGALKVTGGIGVTGNVWIGGNLYVANVIGTTYSQLTVNDPMLYLTANVTYPYNYDIGSYSQFTGGPANVYAHTGFVRSYVNGYWGLFSNIQTEPTGTITWTDPGVVWDQIKVGSIIAANTTAATGNGSTTSGAMYIAGGAGVAGAFYAGSSFDNGNRVVNAGTSGAALPGNLTVNANGAAYLTQVGPGALASQGSATAVPVISTDVYGRITALTTSAIAISATAVSGTIATANVSLYDSVTPYTTNQTFYPIFSNISSAGNTVQGVSSALGFNPSTGNLTTAGFVGTHWGTAGITTGNAATFTITGNAIVNTTMYAQGVFDNGIRVVSTTSGVGNVTISGSSVTLTATGPGAVTTGVGGGSSTLAITTDAYGRIASLANTAIAIDVSQVTNALSTSATIDGGTY